jgi:hypothetical protein
MRAGGGAGRSVTLAPKSVVVARRPSSKQSNTTFIICPRRLLPTRRTPRGDKLLRPSHCLPTRTFLASARWRERVFPRPARGGRKHAVAATRELIRKPKISPGPRRPRTASAACSGPRFHHEAARSRRGWGRPRRTRPPTASPPRPRRAPRAPRGSYHQTP